MNLQSIFSLLVLHSSLAARAAATSANDDNNDVSDEKVGTGCCPPDDPAFQRAMQHPNATGTFTFPGLPLANVSGNNRQQKSSPSVNWTLSTSVMEVSLSSSSSDNDHGKSATNQIFTLDIPLDVPLYSADVQQNVCLVLLDFVGQNRNDPGNCENVFVRSKVEGLRDRLVKAVADTAAKGDGDRSPCSVLGGLWQDIIGPFNHNSTSTTAATRKNTTIAQYHFTSPAHSPSDTAIYDAAITRLKPIMLLSYPTDPKRRARAGEVKTHLSCVRAGDVREGSRGASSSGSSSSAAKRIGGGGGLLWIGLWWVIVSFGGMGCFGEGVAYFRRFFLS